MSHIRGLRRSTGSSFESELYDWISFLAFDSSAEYEFCLETLKINCNYQFSIQV